MGLNRRCQAPPTSGLPARRPSTLANRLMPSRVPVLPVEAVTDGGSGFHHPYTDPLRAKFIRHSRQFMRALQIDVGRGRQVDHHEARQGDSAWMRSRMVVRTWSMLK